MQLSASAIGMPAGACDCHTHVIGPRTTYPMVEDRHYTPGPASLDALRRHLAGLGLQRVVIVQPSVYGVDNRCLLASLDAMDGAARGVAVLPEDVDAAQLRALHAHGVRGVRINLESAGQHDTGLAHAQLRHWSAKVADLGWHVQVYAAQSVVYALADALASLPTPVVIDHFGLATNAPQDDAQRDVLADLLRSGQVCLKLSAAYRLPSAPLADAWAQWLVSVAPQALLWGSDWPHTGRDPGRVAHEVSAYRDVPPAVLARQFDTWLARPELRQQVLADNPARLYDF